MGTDCIPADLLHALPTDLLDSATIDLLPVLLQVDTLLAPEPHACTGRSSTTWTVLGGGELFCPKDASTASNRNVTRHIGVGKFGKFHHFSEISL